jgi:DNA-binding response OmpR family regulator
MAQILVVDDQKYFNQLLTEELTEEGHSVRSVHDAENITEHLNGTAVDVVLLDLFLGNLQGWDVLDSIKAEKPNLPVVILTAYDTYREDPRLAKAAAYVVKNFNLDNLKGTISLVLENSPARQA